MNIYIEYVILNNFVANYMILYLTTCFARSRTIWWRIAISSIIGTIYAVLLPYISFRYDIILKIILSFIMVIVALKVNNIREYMIGVTMFYLVTFMFGGIIIGIGYLMQSDLLNILLYPNNLLATYISIVIILITFILRFIFVKLNAIYNVKSCICDGCIENNGVTEHVRCYLDSGNRLKYGMSSIIVIDESIINKLVNLNSDKYVMIDVQTVNGKSSEKIYSIDSIDIMQNGIHKIYENIYGMCSKRKLIDYDVILHGDM